MTRTGKIWWRIVWTIATLFVTSLLVLGGYLYWLIPQNSGETDLQGVNAPVEVFFDQYGVPHIYASSESDAYHALGYIHASERLFQMELLRRLSGGRLAEILGEDLLEVDIFFRTIGIHKAAVRSAAAFRSHQNQAYYKAAMAYLDGVNEYIDKGKTPVEFSILGIPKSHFSPEDMYMITGYMAFTFAQAFETDPLLDKIQHKLGSTYLKDFIINFDTTALEIPVYTSGKTRYDDDNMDKVARVVSKITHQLAPVPFFTGSNGWLLAPSKTASGKVMLCNDTHMAYAQPAVWYEAHLEYPGFSFYGNYLAGVPFAILGHSPKSGWGLTMFENDDMDFYRLRPDSLNSNHIVVDGQSEALNSEEEIIKIKNQNDYRFQIRYSRFGPIVNDIIKSIDGFKKTVNLASDASQPPVALWWTLHQFPTTSLQGVYDLTRSANLEEAHKAVPQIDVPGLNVMFGDSEGNIAWWAAARLPRRAAHVNPAFILDGSTAANLPNGYHPFEDNPQAYNPPWGYIYTANNQPDSAGGVLQPGYYLADDRARRIDEELRKMKNADSESMKKMMNDHRSATAASNVAVMQEAITKAATLNSEEQQHPAWEALRQWDGSYPADAIAPLVYTHWLYLVSEEAMADELGMPDFEVLQRTHVFYRSLPGLLRNADSPWWDNVQSPEKEDRAQILATAWRRTLSDLSQFYGSNPSQWLWERAHSLEHVHAIGRQKPFHLLFNVGPNPVAGGKEVINNLTYSLNAKADYRVTAGPAMRRIIDFAQPEASLSILPSGQSGYFLSRHYRDQAALFNSGQFRPQLMDRNTIEKEASHFWPIK